MGLRMKNLLLQWFTEKANFQGGSILEQFADLRGSGLGKKRGGGIFEVGEGIDTPMLTMIAWLH